MKKRLRLRNELSSFQWWESNRLHFIFIQIISLIISTGIAYILKPEIVNFFHFSLLLFYLIGANIFYFSGFLLEILIGTSEIGKYKREVSLFYFLFLNVISPFLILGLFVVPVIWRMNGKMSYTETSWRILVRKPIR